MQTSRGLYREGGRESVEWVAIASVVLIVGITCAAIVFSAIGASASGSSGSNLGACESYAAQHNGSTSGC